MKKTFAFIVKILVAAIVAMFAVALCIRYDASDNTVIAVYLGVGILTMLALGAFDVPTKARYESIKHRMGIKKAA